MNAAASRLVDDLRELQQAALAESRAYRVTFSYSDGCYTLEALADTSTRQTVYLEAGVSFLGAPEDIIFYGNGILGKGSQTMPLVCGSHERRVIIAPNFGRIRQEKAK